ncbi:MAG: hypothetical protein H7061_10645 [Bdellovibrionaceae bacterium]|nr:hypothetical protein [Bdellovibrio sp.]
MKLILIITLISSSMAFAASGALEQCKETVRNQYDVELCVTRAQDKNDTKLTQTLKLHRDRLNVLLPYFKSGKYPKLLIAIETSLGDNNHLLTNLNYTLDKCSLRFPQALTGLDGMLRSMDCRINEKNILIESLIDNLNQINAAVEDLR